MTREGGRMSGYGPAARGTHGVRTAADSAVAAEDALKMLKDGNDRFAVGAPLAKHATAKMREALVSHGQAPHAAVFGCADSRVPVDTIFDAMPGDLFVLRNAGNTCTHAEGSMVGSLEFCCGKLGSKLILVLGHTQCGAIAGATKTYLTSKGGNSTKNAGCALEGLLIGLSRVAEQAEEELGVGARLDHLVAHSVKVNVFHSIDFLLKFSEPLRKLVKSGTLLIKLHFTVLFIFYLLLFAILWHHGRHWSMPFFACQATWQEAWKSRVASTTWKRVVWSFSGLLRSRRSCWLLTPAFHPRCRPCRFARLCMGRCHIRMPWSCWKKVMNALQYLCKGLFSTDTVVFRMLKSDAKHTHTHKFFWPAHLDGWVSQWNNPKVGAAISGRLTPSMRKALVKEGQAPHTAIIGCADSRAPLETVFDAMPGDIFVLRNAGNTCTHAEGSMVGSLEFCLAALNTKMATGRSMVPEFWNQEDIFGRMWLKWWLQTGHHPWSFSPYIIINMYYYIH